MLAIVLLLAFPRLQPSDLVNLSQGKVVTKVNFIEPEFVESLLGDISTLRRAGSFKVANIGNDKTLNEEIRVSESFFLSGSNTHTNNEARKTLFGVLDAMQDDLGQNEPMLDKSTMEASYVYYSNGGFYKRHIDAVPNSVSILRRYSFLLYLNQKWEEEDGGQLRVFEGDSTHTQTRNFYDIKPEAGTLVIFPSDSVQHEVLQSKKERLVVVGWFNRKVSLTDVFKINDASLVKQAGLGLASVILILTGLSML